MKNVALTIVRGFSMGAADIVPGVSGGTIALIFGIYQRLLDNVRMGAKALGSFAKLDFRSGGGRLKAVEWQFIGPLGLGLVLAVGLLSSLIERLLQERPEEMAGLFFGLVVASFVIAWKMIRQQTQAEYLIAVGVGVLAFFMLGYQSGPQNNPPLWAYFAAGAIAVCATILPGISGSFLLLMMGMYAAVLSDVHDLQIVNLAALALGMALGLSLFSTGLGWLLDNYHDRLLAALVGLMVGSLRVLWPWPNGVGLLGDDETPPISGTGIEWPDADKFVLPTLLAAGSCVLVLGLNTAANRFQRTKKPPTN